MFEKINTLENAVQIKENLGNEDYNLLIQFLVESYLKTKDEPSMNSFLNSIGIENKQGVIYNYHIYTLQIMLSEELNILGIDLIELLKEKGYEFTPGKLSDLEMKMIGNKLGVVLQLLEFGKKIG